MICVSCRKNSLFLWIIDDILIGTRWVVLLGLGFGDGGGGGGGMFWFSIAVRICWMSEREDAAKAKSTKAGAGVAFHPLEPRQ